MKSIEQMVVKLWYVINNHYFNFPHVFTILEPILPLNFQRNSENELNTGIDADLSENW